MTSRAHLSSSKTLVITAMLAWVGMPASWAITSTSGTGYCEALATRSEVELANIRADFDHKPNYTHEVERTSIKDQCASSSCWVYSGISNLEGAVLATTGKTLNLSEQYLILISIKLKILEALASPGAQFRPGGSAPHVDWLVQSVGIVPAEVWQPRVDFQPAALSKRFYYFINARIAQHHVESALAKTPAEKQSIFERAAADLSELVESYSGPLPGAFTFEGVNYDSPQAFAKARIVSDSRTTIRYTPPEPDLPESMNTVLNQLKPTSKSVKKTEPWIPRTSTTREASVREIGEKIKDALERGESVRIGYESVGEFNDTKTGVMSISAFFLPKGFQPPSRKYRSAYAFKGTGHAVEVVGVDVDPGTGKIIKFKIKNSHGQKTGDQGYSHMYWDYFEAFLGSAYIRERGEP